MNKNENGMTFDYGLDRVTEADRAEGNQGFAPQDPASSPYEMPAGVDPWYGPNHWYGVRVTAKAGK